MNESMIHNPPFIIMSPNNFGTSQLIEGGKIFRINIFGIKIHDDIIKILNDIIHVLELKRNLISLDVANSNACIYKVESEFTKMLKKNALFMKKR